MAMQVLANLLIGLLWVFFQDDWSVLTFFSGYLFGLFVIFILRRFLPTKFYLFTLHAVFRLILLFITEIIVSSIVVISIIIRPKMNIKPGIFSMETTLKGDVEVTLLALLITLTPGSVVVEISEDNKIFYIHTMDIPDLSNSVLKSKDRFENAIKKVTRS
ncbi:MAG: Na+/H+ antiporter subunit E [Anaerovoracaceae bacterium]|jgi:multicomponent Na+:H+ antiporter subunit E|nr:Na+/H+ antiporter subunit E [Clostridiales bacterium]